MREIRTVALEGWPSGLRRTPGKRVGVKAPRGFESPSLRHTPLFHVTFYYLLVRKKGLLIDDTDTSDLGIQIKKLQRANRHS